MARKKEEKQKLHTYIAEHDGQYMGGISVVVAQDRAKARRMVRKAIKERYTKKCWAIPEKLPVTLKEVPTNSRYVKILWDGDY